MKPTAWYDPTNGMVSADKDSPLFTPLGQVLPLYPQPEERNFCPRCGKRTADLTTIHTCTPPLEIDPNKWAFDNGLEST